MDTKKNHKIQLTIFVLLGQRNTFQNHTIVKIKY